MVTWQVSGVGVFFNSDFSMTHSMALLCVRWDFSGPVK